MMPRYEPVEARIMSHPDGRIASPYGAHPGPGFRLVSMGWTIRDNLCNTVGLGRKPYASLQEAREVCVLLNAPPDPEIGF